VEMMKVKGKTFNKNYQQIMPLRNKNHGNDWILV
jgi:hypothetical protein